MGTASEEEREGERGTGGLGVQGLRDFDSLEADAVINIVCKVSFYGSDAGDLMHISRSAHEICTLHQLKAAVAQVEPVGVKRASLVGDEHNAVELMNFDKKLKLIDHALLFETGLGVAGETGRPAGQGHTVVPWEVKAVLEKVVAVFTNSTIRAVDGSGPDAGAVIR